jgi:hypothetical protein
MNLKPPYSGLKKWKIISKFPVVFINNQIASCRCGFNVWWQFPLLHNTPFFHRRNDSYGVANIHPSAFDELINTKSLVHTGQAYATHVKSKVHFIFSCSIINSTVLKSRIIPFRTWTNQYENLSFRMAVTILVIHRLYEIETLSLRTEKLITFQLLERFIATVFSELDTVIQVYIYIYIYIYVCVCVCVCIHACKCKFSVGHYWIARN